MKYYLVVLSLLLTYLLPAQKASYSPMHNLTLETKWPKQVKIQRSNNNVDLVRFDGRYYMAFRTGPYHYASAKVQLYIVSSADLVTWTFEDSVKLGTDLREPRLYTYHDSLFMLFFKGGTNLFKFEPKEMLIVCKSKTGSWSAPFSTGLNSYVTWRIHERKDTLYLSAYYGKNLYNAGHQADLRLFQSTDGRVWWPISHEPQINTEFAEEGEFIFDRKGDLYGVARMEGIGSLLTYCHHDSLCVWHTISSKYKYDSSLLFKDSDDNIYLISRRNLAGTVDKAPKWASAKFARKINLMRYVLSNKVTALFKYDKEKKELVHMLDFPSTGDTAFPAMVELSKGKFFFLNYSSDFTTGPKNWLNGQFGKTYLYSTILEIN